MSDTVAAALWGMLGTVLASLIATIGVLLNRKWRDARDRRETGDPEVAEVYRDLLRSLRSQISDLEEKVERLSEENERQSRQITSLERRNDRCERETARLQARIDQLLDAKS